MRKLLGANVGKRRFGLRVVKAAQGKEFLRMEEERRRRNKKGKKKLQLGTDWREIKNGLDS